MKYSDFWHKEIPCSNQQAIQTEIKTFLADRIIKLEKIGIGFEHIDDIGGFAEATPSLTAWLKELGCSFYRNIALVVIGANKNQSIHTDAQKNDLALNIGLQVKDTTTQMYKIVEGEPVTVPYGSQGLVYISYNNCKLEPYTNFSLEFQPVLFNTKHVHNVVNPTDATRVAISIRFVEDPSYLINH
jgi:hypothetical protein